MLNYQRVIKHGKLDNPLLVGGLEHFFMFPNSWDDDPIWLSYFPEGLFYHQPDKHVPIF